MYIYKTHKYQNFIIEIVADYDPTNPRDWDNLGTIVCWHRKYNLGDGLPNRLKKRFKNWKTTEITSFERWRKINQKHLLILPVYIYDHGGITISTTPFHCPSDSGQVGWVYVTHDRLKLEYNTQEVTPEILEKARQVLIAEVKVYDDYLTGNVWGYLIWDKNNRDYVLDAYSGFFGDSGLEECIKQARESAESQEKKQLPLLFL
jgi:hypothetical protein